MDDNPLGLGPKTVRWLGHRTVDVPDHRPSTADGEPVIPRAIRECLPEF